MAADTRSRYNPFMWMVLSIALSTTLAAPPVDVLRGDFLGTPVAMHPPVGLSRAPGFVDLLFFDGPVTCDQLDRMTASDGTLLARLELEPGLPVLDPAWPVSKTAWVPTSGRIELGPVPAVGATSWVDVSLDGTNTRLHGRIPYTLCQPFRPPVTVTFQPELQQEAHEIGRDTYFRLQFTGPAGWVKSTYGIRRAPDVRTKFRIRLMRPEGWTQLTTGFWGDGDAVRDGATVSELSDRTAPDGSAIRRYQFQFPSKEAWRVVQVVKRIDQALVACSLTTPIRTPVDVVDAAEHACLSVEGAPWSPTR